MNDAKPTALAWLQLVYNDLKTGMSFDDFVSQLRLDSYEKALSVSELNQWLQIIGENIQRSASVASQVRAKIASKYGPYPGMVPNRKSIQTGFTNLNANSWTFWDINKVKPELASKVFKAKVVTDSKGVMTYKEPLSPAMIGGGIVLVGALVFGLARSK